MHLRLHSGERPHACATCARTFTDAANLRRHQEGRKACRPVTARTRGWLGEATTPVKEEVEEAANPAVHERVIDDSGPAEGVDQVAVEVGEAPAYLARAAPVAEELKVGVVEEVTVGEVKEGM